MTAMVSVVDISNIARGNVSITSKFLPSESIAALREDARALLKAGAFVSGELKIDRKRRRHEESKTTTIDKRTRQTNFTHERNRTRRRDSIDDTLIILAMKTDHLYERYHYCYT